MAAFVRMDFIEEISYPLTFVLTLAKTVVPLIIYFFIGDLVRDARVGGDYLTYTTIGLAISAVMLGAMSGFGGVLQRQFARGTLEGLLVEPVPWTFLPIAMNLWQLILSLVSGAALFGMGLWLGADFIASGIPAALLLLVLGLIAANAIGIVAAAVLMLTLKSSPILTVYNLAASLLAGSVFSVSQLPDWLQWVSWLIPHTYAINGIRTALMADPGSFTISVQNAAIALLVFDITIFPIGVWMFKRSLEFARKMGILSGY